MYHDKVYSLLALCSEGSDLKVDYSLTRQQLAVQAFTTNKQRFCLCTVFVVVEALGLVRKTAKIEPHAGWVVSSHTTTGPILAQCILLTASSSGNVTGVETFCDSHRGSINPHSSPWQRGKAVTSCELV